MLPPYPTLTRLTAGAFGLTVPGYKPVLLRLATIDGLPGYVSMDRGVLQTTVLEIREGRIAAVYMTRNPEKLLHVAQMVGDIV